MSVEGSPADPGAARTRSTRSDAFTIARSSAPLIVSKVVSVGFLGIVAILAARGLGPGARGRLALYAAIGTWLPLLGTLGVGTVAQIRLVATPQPGVRTLKLGEFTGAALVLTI